MNPIYEIELEDCPFCGGPGVMQEENGWCVYVECPDCGKKLEVFGRSHINEVSIEYNLPVLARIPTSFMHGSSATAQQSQSTDILHITFIYTMFPLNML